MIMMVACAVLGAALGLYAKPRWLGVAIALFLAGAVEGGQLLVIQLIAHQPNRERLIEHLQTIFGAGVLGAVGPLAAALIGGGLAAIMGKAMDGDGPDHAVNTDAIRRKVGKNGRYARMEGMVEERRIHARAESRIDKILDL
ncbi:hypothetical protein PMI01_05261 [Caulobacter sp. AP07]|uniref:hypothetical protein n=1 Tax=Caulobacter sp. AP07 TaxID=1144304 RepID=UPI00027220FE|nr:hypothetical protein [Caulobacter sp. AP07]EJL21256.1 hypothetical protein PMI01_05261 [Caulobacter sp. AP07]